MILLTRKEEAAKWTPIGTLCETMGFIVRFPCLPPQRAVAVPVLLKTQCFQVWGSNPSQGNFSLFSLLSTFCDVQSMENIFIDWLKWIVIGVTSQKIAMTGVRTPDLETWNLRWKWNTRSTRSETTLWKKTGKAPNDAHYFTQCSNGCSLGSFLFPRQDNHVQRFTQQSLLTSAPRKDTKG